MIQLSPQFLAQELAANISNLAESMSDPVCLTAQDGRIEWSNGGFYDLFGYGLSDVAGRGLLAVLSGEKTDSDAKSCFENAAAVGLEYCSELCLTKRSGGRTWVSLRVNPSYDAKGNVEHLIWVFRELEGCNQLQKENEALLKLLDSLI